MKQGADKIVYRVCPIENTAAERETHFYIDPLETYKAEITAEFEQLEIVGFYHSHPNFKAIPSCEDKDFMIEGYAYPIVSVRNGKFEEIRCFEKEINKRLAYDKTASYLILSLMNADEPVLNSFRIDVTQAEKETLVIAKLDHSSVTLLDLREPDEVIVSGFADALNIPFGDIGKRLDEVPKDRPVYVFCRTGDWSAEVAEILADRGYDVYDLAGGYKAYKEYLSNAEPIHIDAKGLKCPGPIVKTADIIRGLSDGQKVFVEATEDAFASDIAVWCQRTGNILEKLEVKSDVIEATVEKRTKPPETETARPDGKTFMVFSGDLDKTIAAFIMANGSAAKRLSVTILLSAVMRSLQRHFPQILE